MARKRILVSGSGIAGLTFAIQLRQSGFDPLVIEREPHLRREGYMMDFFGTGWDVAERMGLTDQLRAVRYPIDTLEFIDRAGQAYVHLPIERLRSALDGKYVYLRRQDLERILADRANEVGVEVRYRTSLAAIDERDGRVLARFDTGQEDDFDLVVGADGVHSRVRELVFGPERQFARFLGLYVAAFHFVRGDIPVTRAATIYEETDRLAIVYPLEESRFDATICFRHDETDVPHEERLDFFRNQMRGAGWVLPKVLGAKSGPLFFDNVTQIQMPQWHRGRTVLIGDACGCLTLLAGQGSHMAMAGGYLLAEEIARRPDDYAAAFAAYQDFLKPHVDRKRRDAARFARFFVPSRRSRPWLRRLALKLLFSPPLIKNGLALFGTKSVLAGRA